MEQIAELVFSQNSDLMNCSCFVYLDQSSVITNHTSSAFFAFFYSDNYFVSLTPTLPLPLGPQICKYIQSRLIAAVQALLPSDLLTQGRGVWNKKKIKMCCGFTELLAQPVNIFCTYSKIPPNNAQKAASIDSGNHIANFFLTPKWAMGSFLIIDNTIKNCGI